MALIAKESSVGVCCYHENKKQTCPIVYQVSNSAWHKTKPIWVSHSGQALDILIVKITSYCLYFGPVKPPSLKPKENTCNQLIYVLLDIRNDWVNRFNPSMLLGRILSFNLSNLFAIWNFFNPNGLYDRAQLHSVWLKILHCTSFFNRGCIE